MSSNGWYDSEEEWRVLGKPCPSWTFVIWHPDTEPSEPVQGVNVKFNGDIRRTIAFDDKVLIFPTVRMKEDER